MKNLNWLSLILVFLTFFMGMLNGIQENMKKHKSRFAMVVGANDGGPDRIKLRYATSDAEAIKSVLVDMGGVPNDKCIILDQPNRQRFFSEMTKMQKRIQKAISENNKVESIFYYSGHSDENHIFLGNEKITYKELRDIIRSTNADVHIAILDACSSGAFTRLKGGKKVSPLMIDNAYDMKGYAFMTSSSADESSQESDTIQGSFFTHHLVSGLRGAADMSGDGRVSLSEAYQFAFNQTLSQTEKTIDGPQHPNYNIQMSGTGDVLMTEIRKSKSVLIIGKKIFGKVFIHNQDNVLIVEFTKPLGRTIELGLEKGNYRIVNIRDGQIFESKIILEEGSIYYLKSTEFVESEKLVTRSRGETPDKPEKVKSKQYSHRPFEFSFLALPGFRTNSITNFSLHILSSRCTFLKGLSIGPGVGMVDEDVHGVQIAGIGNHVGKDMKYLQMAGIFNSALGNVTGFQAAGLVNFTRRDLTGVQAAGLFNSNIRNIEGIQAAGLVNYTKSIIGLQSSGLINFVSYEVVGAQMTGLVNFARIITGVQVSTLNVSGYTQGAQIGVLNISGQVDGGQIGVINIAKDVQYFSLGLLNFILKGKTDINLWSDELGFVNFGIKHGTDKFYNLYMIGSDLTFAQGCWGLGYGVNISTKKRLNLSIDLLAKAIYPEKRMFSNDLGLLASLRFIAGYKLSKNISIFGGISCNYFNNFDDDYIDIPKPFHGVTFRWDERDKKFWPGIFIGMEFPIINGKKN